MSQAPNYCIQARNATAVNILRSWLRAVSIPFASSKAPGHDLTITKAEGGELEVKVAMNGDLASTIGLTVAAGDITGRRHQSALDAFYAITDAAGYERRVPVDRGVSVRLDEKGNVRLSNKGNPAKLSYREEAFLCGIRHTEFRRSPDPEEAAWKRYKGVMEKVVWKFFQANYEMCCRQAVDVKDLMQYARCLMVNFCARYETPTPVWNDNERKFYRYLQQRFHYDIRDIMTKSERSTMPDCETVRIAIGETEFTDPFDAYITVLDAPDEELEEARAIVRTGSKDDLPEVFEMTEKVDRKYIERNCELDVSSTSARRTSAAAKLTELLGSLEHDQMVQLLRGAADNFAFDFVTRREALRQLRLHERSCDSCASAQALIEEEEELSSTDTASAEE